jgi:hypothetical protein
MCAVQKKSKYFQSKVLFFYISILQIFKKNFFSENILYLIILQSIINITEISIFYKDK